MDVKNLVKSIKSGDSKDILTDVGALVVDVVAAAVPIVPGGAGAAVSALRKGDKIVDGVKAIDKSTDSAKSFALRLGPKANKGVSRPHGGEEHNSVIDMVLETAVKANANPETLRKNQKQVDAKGFQRGNNRPHFQFDIGDIHYSGEVDYSPSRSENHGRVIRNNDPNTVLIRMLLKK